VWEETGAPVAGEVDGELRARGLRQLAVRDQEREWRLGDVDVRRRETGGIEVWARHVGAGSWAAQ
jgi:hypothetical protein